MPAPSTHVLPKIECFTLGPFATNSYLINCADAWWVVDPSFEPQPLLARLAALRATPQAILLTHAHADHIAGLADVRRAFPGVPTMLHSAEAAWLEDPELNLSALYGVPLSFAPAEQSIEHNQTLTLGPSTWRVLHVPGHSPGSVAFHHEPSATLISGDALFAGSIGRTDFPGSDFDTLAASIRQRLYTLPDHTTLYPGHGPTTTIGREKRSNPYVRP